MIRTGLSLIILLFQSYFIASGQSTDTIMIGDDSLVINNESYENHEEGLKIIEGNIGLIKTQAICRPENHDYFLIFGFLNKISKQPPNGNNVILLCEKDRVIDTLIIDLNPGYNMMYGFKSLNNLTLNPHADAFISNYARGSCGAAVYDVLFFVKDSRFVYGLRTRSQGDIDSEFTSQTVITKKEIPKNEVWVELAFGDTFDDKRTDYLKHIQKYKWNGKTLEHINPLSPQFLYVTAKSGVKERNTPYTNGHSERIHPFGAKLKILHKTSLEMTITDDGGNKVTDSWYQIESITEDGYSYPAYVFGAFLDNKNPKSP